MFLEVIIALILGLSIGSFLNVVIYRLPLSIDTKTTLTLNNPKRSFCPLCHTTLSVFELIPVFSYLLQKGKCRHCHTTISWQYPLVETITALISALIVFIFGATIQAGFYLLLAWFLIALFVIDLKEQLLPDVLTLPLMWLGLVYQIEYGNLQDLQEGVIGAMSGYLFLWLIYWAFKLLRHKEGMGYGDFKLTAALGAWIGWQAMPLLLLVASVLSVVFFLLSRLSALSRLSTKLKRGQAFAFGPFLIVGFVVVGMVVLS
jgi:leader peptidase (prepilin peptidase)/N-methyltransferase